LQSDITPGMLPPSITSLTLDRFNRVIEPGALPHRLLSLNLGHKFDQPLSIGVLPSSITELYHGQDQKTLLSPGIKSPSGNHVLFINDTMIRFEKNMIQPSILPTSLTSLAFFKLGEGIPFGSFPDTIKSLMLCYKFNEPITPGTLPPLLESLTFGEMFDQKIEYGTFPGTLIELHFGQQFNRDLHPGGVRVLPNNLRTLTLGGEFNQHLYPDILPDTLTSLECYIKKLSSDGLPKSITWLKIGHGGGIRHMYQEYLPNLIHLFIPNLDHLHTLGDDVNIDHLYICQRRCFRSVLEMRQFIFPIRLISVHLVLDYKVATRLENTTELFGTFPNVLDICICLFIDQVDYVLRKIDKTHFIYMSRNNLRKWTFKVINLKSLPIHLSS
ncbi:hypothetical protein SAMD00019534_115730, partial [Acytostelium subglobosum LB1]|uniref:hypothetical protein n=1 Tax=Acytostelium subglobosum LB1 TaxID=1410327 RepID=UPI000644D63E